MCALVVVITCTLISWHFHWALKSKKSEGKFQNCIGNNSKNVHLLIFQFMEHSIFFLVISEMIRYEFRIYDSESRAIERCWKRLLLSFVTIYLCSTPSPPKVGDEVWCQGNFQDTTYSIKILCRWKCSRKQLILIICKISSISIYNTIYIIKGHLR